MKEVFEKIIEKLANLGWVFADYYPDRTNISRVSKKSVPYDEVVEIVKQAAAEYNNGWISCSERLPDVPEGIEDDECPEFNVTVKGADQATTLKCASDGTWFDDLGYTYDVIAWQPLPTPYNQHICTNMEGGPERKRN